MKGWGEHFNHVVTGLRCRNSNNSSPGLRWSFHHQTVRGQDCPDTFPATQVNGRRKSFHQALVYCTWPSIAQLYYLQSKCILLACFQRKDVLCLQKNFKNLFLACLFCRIETVQIRKKVMKFFLLPCDSLSLTMADWRPWDDLSVHCSEWPNQSTHRFFRHFHWDLNSGTGSVKIPQLCGETMTFSKKEERPVALLIFYHSSVVNVSFVYPWHNESTRNWIQRYTVFYIFLYLCTITLVKFIS